MTFVFKKISDIFSVSMFVVLLLYIFSFHNHDRCHVYFNFFKLNILFTMSGLLIGMRVNVNCVCRLLHFFLQKI